MGDIYQHIPQLIHPVVFTIGFFSLYWYAVMYLTAMSVSSIILWRLLRSKVTFDEFVDIVFAIVMGVLVGARLGYVVVYNSNYYFQNPLAIFSPFDAVTGQWIGIAGMSFFGGCAGALLGMWLSVRSLRVSKQYAITFLQLVDLVALALPFGYFFGRIGNFFNGELYGRVTEHAWGMYFSSAPLGEQYLRHPSQLYEAFGEGALLGCVLWYMYKRCKLPDGMLAVLYGGGYAGIRFFLEFYREPDPQSGYIWTYFTMGQLLAVLLLILSLTFYYFRRKL